MQFNSLNQYYYWEYIYNGPINSKCSYVYIYLKIDAYTCLFIKSWNIDWYDNKLALYIFRGEIIQLI